MKKRFLSKYIIASLLLVGGALGFVSCDDDANDWAVDSNMAQMFTPVVFETAQIRATSVDLAFSTVPNAESYVIEYSKDSLQFADIAGTAVVFADALVPDTISNSSNKYLALIENLDASSRYSARIKATSNNGLPESKWASITFKTPGEQVLNAPSAVTGNSAVLSWEAGIAVTKILLAPTANTENKKGIILSQEDIANGTVTLTGLQESTEYRVEIYNDKTKRGTLTFKTDESIPDNGVKYEVKANTNLADLISTITDERVILVFSAGTAYSLDAAWEIPEHIKSLTLWGRSSENDEPKASVTMKSIKLSASNSEFNLRIHNMNVSGTDASADYILNDEGTTTRVIPEIKIDNCDLSSFRGLIRMRGNNTVQNIDIDNCIINNLGSYGLITSDAAAVVVGNVSLTNSTVYNISGASVMTYKGTVSSLIMEYCTFFDVQAKDKYVVNFDGKQANIPSVLKIEKCIFAGSDTSITVRGTNPKIESQFVYNSYKTSDYTVATNYPLSGINEYSRLSSDIFENTAEGNFKIVDIAIGDGMNPGDPRWW